MVSTLLEKEVFEELSLKEGFSVHLEILSSEYLNLEIVKQMFFSRMVRNFDQGKSEHIVFW